MRTFLRRILIPHAILHIDTLRKWQISQTREGKYRPEHDEVVVFQYDNEGDYFTFAFFS